MHRLGLAALSLIAVPAALFAQFAPPSGGCPPGMHLEGFACVYDAPARAPSPPQPVWATRWGAVAISQGASSTGFGAVTNAKSERKARSLAMKQCDATRVGGMCKSFTYYNQCIAIAWGLTKFRVGAAETVEIATSLAMKDCQAEDDGCHIYYSACSYPFRVR